MPIPVGRSPYYTVLWVFIIHAYQPCGYCTSSNPSRCLLWISSVAIMTMSKSASYATQPLLSKSKMTRPLSPNYHCLWLFMSSCGHFASGVESVGSMFVLMESINMDGIGVVQSFPMEPRSHPCGRSASTQWLPTWKCSFNICPVSVATLLPKRNLREREVKEPTDNKLGAGLWDLASCSGHHFQEPIALW